MLTSPSRCFCSNHILHKTSPSSSQTTPHRTSPATIDANFPLSSSPTPTSRYASLAPPNLHLSTPGYTYLQAQRGYWAQVVLFKGLSWDRSGDISNHLPSWFGRMEWSTTEPHERDIERSRKRLFCVVIRGEVAEEMPFGSNWWSWFSRPLSTSKRLFS